MDGSNLGSRDCDVSVSSIWSMAGMTVTRFGVDLKKKRVVSLKI
jgi:hypothetical protein